MKQAGKIFRAIYFCYFYVTFGIILSLLYPLMYILLQNPRHYPRVHSIRKWGCRLTLLLTGIRYKKIGEKNWQHPVIFCTNHSSTLDIIVTLAALDDYHHYMGKRELADIPLFGTFFSYMDIPVERRTKAGLYKAYQQAESDLKKKIDLVIFPEGTTRLSSPKLGPFKAGAFKLAVNNGVTIVPVTFLDHWRLMHYDRKWDARPGVSRIIFHEPLVPQENTEAEVNKLKEETFKAIDTTIKHYYPYENRRSDHRQDSGAGQAAI